jgi:hypothetical protein
MIIIILILILTAQLNDILHFTRQTKVIHGNMTMLDISICNFVYEVSTYIVIAPHGTLLYK